MKKIIINAVLLAVIGLCFGTAAYGQRILGGYQKAATDNKDVVAAAEFAVSKQFEKEGQEGLTLESVDVAETQSVAGKNFRLCLTVSIDDETQQVKVIVSRPLKKPFVLKSWTVEDCGPDE